MIERHLLYEQPETKSSNDGHTNMGIGRIALYYGDQYAEEIIVDNTQEISQFDTSEQRIIEDLIRPEIEDAMDNRAKGFKTITECKLNELDAHKKYSRAIVGERQVDTPSYPQAAFKGVSSRMLQRATNKSHDKISHKRALVPHVLMVRHFEAEHSDLPDQELRTAFLLRKAVKPPYIRLEDYESSIYAARQITHAEKVMWASIEQHVTTIDKWNHFESWVAEAAAAGTGDIDPMLEMLAVDCIDPASKGIVAKLVTSLLSEENLATTAHKLNEVLTSDSVIASWLELVMAQREGVNKAEFIMTNQSILPDMFKSALASAGIKLQSNSMSRLKEVLSGYNMQLQAVPIVERTIGVKDTEPLSTVPFNSKIKTKREKPTNNGRATPSSKITASADKEVVIPKNSLIRLVIGQNHSVIWADEPVEELGTLAENFLADYQGDYNLQRDIMCMLESLKEQPFGDGTIPLAKHHLRQREGNVVKIRRLNPCERHSLTQTTAIARGTRIIYSTRRNNTGGKDVGVIAILKRNQYDAWKP